MEPYVRAKLEEKGYGVRITFHRDSKTVGAGHGDLGQAFVLALLSAKAEAGRRPITVGPILDPSDPGSDNRPPWQRRIDRLVQKERDLREHEKMLREKPRSIFDCDDDSVFTFSPKRKTEEKASPPVQPVEVKKEQRKEEQRIRELKREFAELTDDFRKKHTRIAPLSEELERHNSLSKRWFRGGDLSSEEFEEFKELSDDANARLRMLEVYQNHVKQTLDRQREILVELKRLKKVDLTTSVEETPVKKAFRQVSEEYGTDWWDGKPAAEAGPELDRLQELLEQHQQDK